MITKIQSFTDVITNSSSTVFIMHQADAKYYESEYKDAVSIEKINMDWLRNNSNEVEAIFKILKLDPSMITTHHNVSYWGYWETPNKETWESFLELYKNKIEEAFRDLYWVNIEDYFENAYDVIESAKDDGMWHENRH